MRTTPLCFYEAAPAFMVLRGSAEFAPPSIQRTLRKGFRTCPMVLVWGQGPLMAA